LLLGNDVVVYGLTTGVMPYKMILQYR